MKKAINFSIFILLCLLQMFTANAQWVQTNGPNGAFVTSLAVSGANVFAGTNDAGVFLSSNNGNSWVGVNNGLTNKTVTSSAVIGTNIFAGTSDGVFLTNNNGASWVPVNSGMSGYSVRKLAVIGTTLFAGTDDGVFRSTNNGTSWTAVNSGIPSSSFLEIFSLAVNGTTLFATTEEGIFRSTNNGTSWTAANSGIPSSPFGYQYSLAVHGTTIYAVGSDGVFRSTNNGTSWTAVTNALANATSLTFVVNGANILAGTDIGMFLSTNDGSSWSVVNSGLTNLSVTTLGVVGSTLIAGTSSEIFVSANNGSSWTSSNSGIVGTSIKASAIIGTTLFAATSNRVFLSNNNGNSWASVSNGLANKEIKTLVASGTTLFAGTDDGIFRSTNNGSSWAAANTGLTDTYITAMAVSGTTVFVGTYDDGVFRSTNNGTSWTAVNSGIPSSSFLEIFSLAVNGTTLFATTEEGIFRSTNNGTSWTAANSGIPSSPFGYQYSLAVHGTTIYAFGYDGVFRSTNNGTSWTAVTNALANVEYLTFAASSTKIFAGTDSGVFVSTDSGNSWTPNNNGLINDYVYSLVIIGTNIFAGTNGGGVYISQTETVISLDVSPATISQTAAAGSANISVTSNCSSWAVSNVPVWATVTPTSGSNNGNITVSFQANTSPQSRSATITIAGCSISRMVNITQAGAASSIPWVRSITGSNHIVIAQAALTATLDGTPLEPGDAIGFFFERNDSLHCSNYLTLTGQNASVAVYGNDATSPGKNGFAPGETFKIKIYKASTQQVFDAQAMFAPAGTVIPPLTITQTQTYTTNGISLLTQVNANSAIRPLAAFSADTLCGTAPLTIQFSDQSSNSPLEWHWDFGNGAVSLEQSPTAVFAEPGIYTVRLIAANAAGQDTLERVNYITVVGQVSATVLPGDTICAGTRLELQAEGAESYVWSGQNLETETGAVTGATLTEAGNYVYQVVGSTNNCAAPPAAVTVYVRPIPVVMLSVSADSICRQGILSLSASGASTYTWQGVGLSAGTGSMVTAIPDTSGLITYSVTGSTDGCTSAVRKREVWVHPHPQIIASADRFSICLGDTVTLSAVGADVIFWNGSGLLSLSGAEVEASPQQTGTITYQVSGNTAGCPAQAASVSIEVNSNVLSTVITVSDCPGPNLVFSAAVNNGGGFPNILWYRNGQPVWNGSQYTLFGAQNGDEIYCKVTPVNAPPCTTPSQAQSNSIVVNCIPSEVLETLPGIEEWKVYPNPNNGEFYLSLSNTEAVTVHIRVLDMLGRPVWHEQAQWPEGQQRHRIALPSAVPGVYWVVLESRGQLMRKGVVVR